MRQMYPDVEETPESREGTASHEIGERLITAATRGGVNAPTWETLDGQADSNGELFIEEMFDAAEMYANDVKSVMQSTGVFGGDNLGIEEHVHAPQIHDLSEGTLDCRLFDIVNLRLYAWDYKFGRVPVEVFENLQLINYVAGIFHKMNINGFDDQQLTVHFRVIQPRAFHREGSIREWVVQASDLRGFINQLHDKASEALGTNAICRTGPQCWNCSARLNCDVAIAAGPALYNLASTPQPVEMSPHAMGLQLKFTQSAIKHLEKIESALKEQVKGTVRSGTLVPGWLSEMGFGKLKWNKSYEEVILLGEMMSTPDNVIDLRQKKPITPTQAISRFAIDEAVISAYSDKPRTGLILVPDNGNRAKKVFTS
jgi:hypothetical protein